MQINNSEISDHDQQHSYNNIVNLDNSSIENIFGFKYFNLNNIIELGELIIQHYRYNSSCNDLIQQDAICLSYALINNLDEAEFLNSFFLDKTILDQSKKIRKKKQFLDKQFVIKKNAYLIRKLTNIGMNKTNISALIRISESSIYYKEKQIPYSQKYQTFFYFSQHHLDWLTNDVQQSDFIDVQNQQQIYQLFKTHFALDDNSISLSHFRKQMKLNGITYKQVLPRGVGYFQPERQQLLIEHSKTLLSYIKEQYNLLFIDVKTFSHQSINPRCWRIFHSKKNLNVIGCICLNGFQCYQICIRNVNSYIFAQFIEKLIQQIENTFHNQNSPIHQSNFIKKSYLNKINNLSLPRIKSY